MTKRSKKNKKKDPNENGSWWGDLLGFLLVVFFAD